MKHLLITLVILAMLLTACRPASVEAAPTLDAGALAVGSVGSAPPSTRISVLDTATAISAGVFHTVILRPDRTVQAVGDGRHGQLEVANWQDIVGVAAGRFHTVGLRADGTVVATAIICDIWQDSGQSDVSDWQDIIAVSAGHHHTVGLRADGTVLAVGYGGHGQLEVDNWRDIVAISAGNFHTVGLRANGTVVTTGGFTRELDVSEKWSDIIYVSAGGCYTIGLRSDGTVLESVRTGWPIEYWEDIVTVSAGSVHVVGLKSNGNIIAAGNSDWIFSNASGWQDITAISAGHYHTVGLKSNGTVVAVGDNYYRQIGYIYLDEFGVEIPRREAPILEGVDEWKVDGFFIIGDPYAQADEEELLPLDFDLPDGFEILVALARGGRSTYIFQHRYAMVESNSFVMRANPITLNMRPFQTPPYLVNERLNTGKLDGHTIFYRYPRCAFSNYYEIIFEKDFIIYEFRSRNSIAGIIILSRAIIGNADVQDKSAVPYYWLKYLEQPTIQAHIIWHDPNREPIPLGFTLPDGFYKVCCLPRYEDGIWHTFRLKCPNQRYIVFDRRNWEFFCHEWLVDEWNSVLLNGYKIYYLVEAEITNQVAFELNGFFYNICGENLVNIELETLLLLVEAVLRG